MEILSVSATTGAIRVENGRIVDTTSEYVKKAMEDWTKFEAEGHFVKAPKTKVIDLGISYNGAGLILMKDIEVLYSPRS